MTSLELMLMQGRGRPTEAKERVDELTSGTDLFFQ